MNLRERPRWRGRFRRTGEYRIYGPRGFFLVVRCPPTIDRFPYHLVRALRTRTGRLSVVDQGYFRNRREAIQLAEQLLRSP